MYCFINLSKLSFNMFSTEAFNNIVQNIDNKDKSEQNLVEEQVKTDLKQEVKIPENPHQDNLELKLNEVKRVGAPLYIDLNALSANNKVLENSEVILAIFEITTNSEYYGVTKSNKSRSFWDSLYKVKEFEKILSAYKSETLRKYWRLLSEMKNRKQFLDTVKKYSKEIDSTNLKFLTIITTIKESLAGEISDLVKVLKEAPERHLPKVSSSSRVNRKNSDDESFEIEPKEKKSLLKNKRKSPNEEILNEINKTVEVVNNIMDSTQEPRTSGKRSARIKTNSSLFSEEDKFVFTQIEEIEKVLKTYIPEASDEEIWDALKRNSFNIISTYLYLSDPELYEGK